MDTSDHVLQNVIDKILFIILSGCMVSFLLLWIISNILQTNNYIIWLISVPIAFIAVIFLSRYYSLYHGKITRFTIVCYVILFSLIALGGFFYVEPIIRYPYTSIGIPNKDLHDGITVFIDKYGYPPVENKYLSNDERFIPNTKEGLYLGYPNGMHVVGAYFMKLGAGAFHAIWFAVLLALILCALSIFLLLRLIWGDLLLASIGGGLFLITSSRIPYGIATSIPMAFSYALVLPTFMLGLIAFKQSRNAFSLIIPAIALVVITASYSGIFVISFTMIVLYSGILVFQKKYIEIKKIGMLCILTLPLFIFVLIFQRPIYWQNMFATVRDFDPYELSQYLFPTDKVKYMLVYFSSLVVYIYALLKKESKLYKNPLALLILIINGGLLFLLPFDSLYHSLKDVYSTDALIRTEPGGVFGGLNHQRISRLALLQPYFFIFIFPAVFTLFRSKFLRYTLMMFTLLFIGCITYDIPLYDLQQFRFQNKYGFYNEEHMNKPYILLSHLRFISPAGMWSQDIMDAFDFLKKRPELENSKILLTDERIWPEASIIGWGSVYLQKKLDRFSPDKLSLFKGREVYVMVIVQTTDDINRMSPYVSVYANSQVVIYHIEPGYL